MAVVSTLASTIAGTSVAQTLPSAVGTLQTWNETTRTAPRRASAQPRRTLQLLPWSDTMHAENDEQSIVIEMFEAPNVTPFAAPFVLHPFGPPRRALRLISSFDDEDGLPPRVTVTVTPALTILRDDDGATMQQPEVRIDVVAIPDANALIFLPMRVLSMTDP